MDAGDGGAGPMAGDAAPAPAELVELPEEARRTTLESSPVDQLIGEGRAGDDRPLDIDPTTLDTDRDTGDRDERNDPAGAVFEGESWTSGGGEAPDIEERGAAGESLSEHLHAQVGPASRDPRLAAIAHALVDRLDEAGYLPFPLGEVAEELGIAVAEAEAALALVQTLDPTGVGARSLGECIALQAREADRYDPAMARLIDNLDLVARGEFPRLRRMCGVDEEDLSDMLAELRGYDPKPGLRFGSSGGEPITPDILVNAGPAGWQVAINQATLPRVLVNRSYYVELRGACADKAARGWLSDKLADANWLVKALDQRQKTILKVASELVRQQEGFFRHGVSQLRPLTLRAVAETIGMHESNKYLMCARGTYELKFFFTSGVAATDGEGTVSAEAVKAAIRQLIDAEEPKAILSDDTLVDLLKARGFDLARRTVAKYREAIGLGSSVQRRRQKALAGMR